MIPADRVILEQLLRNQVILPKYAQALRRVLDAEREKPCWCPHGVGAPHRHVLDAEREKPVDAEAPVVCGVCRGLGRYFGHPCPNENCTAPNTA